MNRFEDGRKGGMRKRIAILGSTGSIGSNALNVIANLGKRFEVVGLACDSNVRLLAEQARRFRPKIVSIRDESYVKKINLSLPKGAKVVFGEDGLKEIVKRDDVDIVVFAISGNDALVPLVEAINSKKQIALANKEAMVSAGQVLMPLAKTKGADIIPVDSEHSAIFQCLEGRRKFLSKIYLTGSGGPLLNIRERSFDSLSRSFILRHPKWKMGKKISVDSATMMNKGLEIIEAKHLFGIDEDCIEILVHPEAVIHSMVELLDGTVFAQMACPDMRLPIQYAITYPERCESITKRIDFSGIEKLSFYLPSLKKFPCLGLARAAAKAGGTSPAVLCAADEEAVKNYLGNQIKFTEIPKVIEKVLARHKNSFIKRPRIGDILAAQEWARMEAESLCYH